MEQREEGILMPRDILMLAICEKIEKDRAVAREQKLRAKVRESNRAFAEAMRALREAQAEEAHVDAEV